jgi:hypothetical protein
MSVIELSANEAGPSGTNCGEQIGPLLQRLSGFGLMTGAVGFTIHLVARSVLTAGTSGDMATFATHNLWIPINALGAASAALIILGLSGLYASLAQTRDRLGLLGSVLIGLAWMVLGVFLSLYSMLVLPWLATTLPGQVDGLNSSPPMIVTFGFGLLAELTGTIVLAIPLVRQYSKSRWIGYVLLASALMVLVGDLVLAPDGPAANLAINLLSNLGPMLLMVAVGALGHQLWSCEGSPG